MRPVVHVLVFVDDLYQASGVLSTWPVVGTVNGHGYGLAKIKSAIKKISCSGKLSQGSIFIDG